MKKIVFAIFLISNFVYAQPEDYQVDALVSPKTNEVVITVGGDEADIQGYTNRAIQMAIDALPDAGGMVKLNQGTFILKDAIHLRSNMKLIGSGEATVLKRAKGVKSKMAIDADYAELKVTVEDASGFEVGMSIQILDAEQPGCWDVSMGTITDIDDNTLYFDKYLIRDYHAEPGGWVSNAGAGVSVRHAANVLISDLMVDGNKENTMPVDGCNGGGVAILYSKNVVVERVHIKDFNGEGMTWQITEDVTIQNCEIEGSANIGIHPGTGSPRSKILNNDSHHNAKDGLFICWRVHHSLVKGNKFHHNGRHGICTGHKDTDVVFDDNHIYNNGSDGVNLRSETMLNSPHNNTFINNVIENNGKIDGGYGFGLYSHAKNLVIKNNVIRDTGGKTQKAAVYVAKGFPSFTMEDNIISGHLEGRLVKE